MPSMALPSVSPETLWGSGLALLALAIFSSCMVTVSFLMRGMGSGPGSMLAAAAGVVAGLVVALAQLAFGGGAEPPTLRAVLWFAVAGIFSTYLGRWLVFKSIELMGPSRAAAVQCISPLIIAFFGWLLLGEVLATLGFVGMALGIVGLVTMTLGGQPQLAGTPGRHPVRQGGFVFSSLLVGVGSAAAYSSSYVLRADAVREWNEPLLGSAIGALVGLATLLVASRKQLGGYVREIRANPGGARVYFAVGTMQFTAQVLVIASMRYIPAAVAGLISMSTPVLVMPMSYFLLRKQENLTPAAVLGICITLASLVLVVLYGRPQP